MAVRAVDNTEFYEKKLENVTEMNGPCVQILPLCNVPEIYSRKQRMQAKRIALYKKALVFKTGMKKTKTKKDKVIKFYARFKSYDSLHRGIERTYNMFHNEKCDYVVNLADSTAIDKTTYPKSYFEEKKLITFEGMQMPVPKEADKLMEKRFGYNYHKNLVWGKRKVVKNVVFTNDK